MRFFTSFLLVSLGCAVLAQEYRFGWRDEAATARNAENWSAAVCDKNGDLLVAGTVQLPGNQVDVIVRKYDPLGKRLWERVVDLTGGNLVDAVQSLIVSPNGDVYVSASAPKNGFDNFCLLKLEGTSGSVLFSKILDTGADRATPYGACIDPSTGGVVQAGGYGRNAREQFFVVKWKPDGSVAWQQKWSSADKGDRRATSVACAPNGDVTVGGYSVTATTGEDSVALRYSATGGLQWQSVFPGSATPARDKCTSVCVEPTSGDAIVAGDEYVQGSVNSAYVARLASADGKQVWKNTLLEPKGTAGNVVSIQMNGQTILAAITMNPTSADGFDLGVLGYSLQGKELWRSLTKGGAGFAEDVSAMTLDIYGRIYACAASRDSSKANKYLTACLEPSGSAVWSDRDAASVISAPPAAIAVDSISGHVYAVGGRAQGIDDDASIVGYFQAPKAFADSYSVVTGEKLVVDSDRGLLTNDRFHKFAQFKVVTQPAQGKLEPHADGGFTFTPPAGFTGDVSFTYELSRDGLTTSQAKVTVSVVKKPQG